MASYIELPIDPETPIGWGYSNLPLIPLRAEPSERAEMVTQALYGERMVLLEQHSDWMRVVLSDDGYMGWCSSKMVTSCTLEFWNKLCQQRNARLYQPLLRCVCGGKTLFLPAGSQLLPGDRIVDEVVQEEHTGLNPSEVAKRFLHAPYLWGGKSILGMDCSGLVQLSFSLLGILLPRDAGQQALLGESVKRVEAALPGDLAFFSNQFDKIVHVGLVLPEGSIIHASGSVRIDTLDREGIFNQENKGYSHQLSHIRRLSF